MSEQRFDSVWDAIEDRPAEAANMKARSDLVIAIREVVEPLFKLHPLKGKLRRFWAVTVRANWRIIFRFENGKAFDVDFVDYH